MARLLIVAAAFHLAASQDQPIYNKDLYTGHYHYNPKEKIDPFDSFSQVVSEWLVATEKGQPLPFQCVNAQWENDFCNCLENTNIQAWYQQNSMFYVMHTCNKDHGLVMRTGHMQDRHTMPLQAIMSCDVLKAFSFCFQASCPPAVGNWTDFCEDAHYTVPGCDVTCSSAPHQAVLSSSLIFFAIAAVFGYVAQLA